MVHYENWLLSRCKYDVKMSLFWTNGEPIWNHDYESLSTVTFEATIMYYYANTSAFQPTEIPNEVVIATQDR